MGELQSYIMKKINYFSFMQSNINIDSMLASFAYGDYSVSVKFVIKLL